MLTTALVFGILGGVSAVVGGLTLGGIIPLLHVNFIWSVWFTISFVFLLSSIACGVIGRQSVGGGEED
jgi:hypothetical protein